MENIYLNTKPHTELTDEEINAKKNFDSVINNKSAEKISSSLSTKLLWAAAIVLSMGSLAYFVLPFDNDTKQVVEHKIDSLSVDTSLIHQQRIYLDSLLNTKVNLPQVFNSEYIDSSTVEKFGELAKQSNGEISIVASSTLIKKEIINVLNKNMEEDADVLLLIDKTGSMYDDLTFIKKGLHQIVGTFKKYHVRLAIALYGDKNSDGDDWYSYKCFNYDYELAYDFINEIKVTGGDDYPESVYDGYFEAQKENFWQSKTKRMVVLIGDAPPLEKPLSNYSMKDIIADANSKKIKMNFYPIVVSPSDTVPENEMRKFQKMNFVNSIYPNPSNGEFTIDFGATNIVKIEVYTASGNLILSMNNSDNKINIDLSGKPNGLYIVRAYDLYHNYDEKKIIIQKN
ncbi:MAG: hypothetical protein RJA07_528 [Bacteroidota bacterium]|jgi:hypothetical protein